MSRKIGDAQSRYIRSRLPKLLRVQIKSFCKTWVKLTMHLQPMERIGDQSHKLWIVLICFDVGPGKGRAFQLLRLVGFYLFLPWFIYDVQRFSTGTMIPKLGTISYGTIRFHGDPFRFFAAAMLLNAAERRDLRVVLMHDTRWGRR